MAKKANGNAKAHGNGKTRAKKDPPKPKMSAEALSEEQRQVLFFQHKRKLKPLIDAQKNAATAVQKAFELAKKEGVLKKDIQLALKMETEEGEASVKGEIDRSLQVARWMGAKLGTQYEMFSEAGRKSDVDAIYEDGKRAAMDDQPRKPPDHHGQKASQRWMEGFDAGRVALNNARAQGFKPLSEAVTNVMEQAGIPPGANVHPEPQMPV